MAEGLNTYQNIKGSFKDALSDVVGLPGKIGSGLGINYGGPLKGIDPKSLPMGGLNPSGQPQMGLVKDPKYGGKSLATGDIVGGSNLQNYLPREEFLSLTPEAALGEVEQVRKNALQGVADAQYSQSAAGQAERAASEKKFKASQNEKALAGGRLPYDYSGLAYAGSGAATPPAPVYTPPTYGGTQPTTPPASTPAPSLPVANVGGLKSTDYASGGDFRDALMTALPNNPQVQSMKKTEALKGEVANLQASNPSLGLLEALGQLHDNKTKSLVEYAPGLAATQPRDYSKYELPQMTDRTKNDITSNYGIKPRTYAERGLK